MEKPDLWKQEMKNHTIVKLIVLRRHCERSEAIQLFFWIASGFSPAQ